ncbi:MAG: BON domain-containing protein [Limnochordaceae bacterium]|nr:BON domain-containing protein [Limnochordaceae bacterium]
MDETIGTYDGLSRDPTKSKAPRRIAVSDLYRRPGAPRSQLSPESGTDRSKQESRPPAPVTAARSDRGARAATASERDDDRLAAAVADRLQHDPGLRPYGIKVSLQDGVVTLQGVVDVLADKERARKLAQETPGVVAVENALSISTDGKIDDEDIAMEVAEELAADPRVDQRLIGARVEGGVVHLEGRAPHEGMVRAATEAAARARGVRDLVSHVVLDDQAQTDDATLVNRIEAALAGATTRGVDPQYIEVHSRDSTIQLRGWVKDEAAYEAAVEIAANVEGVARVDGSGLRLGGLPPNQTRATRGPARPHSSSRK